MRIITLIILLLIATPSWATVLFSDNFDSQADWNSSLGTVPTGWYDAGRIENTIGENTMQIKGGSGFYYGSSGKGYVHYNESISEDDCGPSVWCSDGLLGASFTATQEIYVGFMFKMQSGFQYRLETSGGSMKILHVSHLTGAHIYGFQSEDDNVPRLVATFAGEPDADDLRMYSVTHGALYEEVYWNPNNGWTAAENGEAANSLGCNWPGCLDTDTWHSLVFRLKNNTKTGGTYNYDGELEVWTNGTREFLKTTIRWCSSTNISGGEPTDYGWNHAWIGGNNYNNYDTGGAEQWYAVDNFVVATTKAEVDAFLNSGGSKRTLFRR